MRFSSYKKGYALLLLSAALVFVLSLVIFTKPSEPSYQGRGLRTWMQHLRTINQIEFDEAAYALRSIGTNGIPVLLAELAAEDSGLASWFYSKVNKIRGLKFHVLPAKNRQFLAVQAFHVLGYSAQSAIPDLRQMLLHSDHKSQAACALAGVGGESLVILDGARTNENYWVRHEATNGVNLFRSIDGTATTVSLSHWVARTNGTPVYKLVYWADLRTIVRTNDPMKL